MTSVVRTVAGVLGARALAHLTRAQRQDPAAVPKKLGRRSFVRNAALGGVVLNIGLLTGGLLRFLWPNKTGAFGKTLRVPATLIPPVDGQPYVDSAGKFYLVHTQDGVMALYWRCPHLGCTVPPWNPSEQAFHCPCHGSIYNYEGVRTGGPAPRPMDYMTTTVDSATGDLLVDTGAINQRQDYQPSQATPV
ncbi:MAG TPA: Rieske 2Fe-2S domain-containing protein [Thermomicrobiales bacterium]|nr:Rieske 2Fe-2S domain-containing protein [Thermomicrobiales bacterium]